MNIDSYHGINPPFLGGSQNVLSRQSGERLIKNDVKLLVLTVPGERVMRPDMGTDVRRTPFEQFGDQSVQRNLRRQISDQIARYDQRVRLNQVDFIADEANHKLTIAIALSMTDDPATNFLVEVGVTEQRIQ